MPTPMDRSTDIVCPTAVSSDVSSHSRLAGGNPLTHGQGVETEEVPLVYIPEDAFDVLGEDDSHLLRQNAGNNAPI